MLLYRFGDSKMNALGESVRALEPIQPSFTRDGARFVRLLLKGGLLQLVTVGFYRFWLLTDIRRHIWSATSVEGDALEYTGRGKELLFGFLFALAILAPVFAIYFLVGLEAERYRAFASAPLYLFLFFFGQYAVYRGRRYRLTRTIWRGVRFWMTGSGWKYALRSLGWLLLVVVTLGIVYPWREAALERYKMANTRFGDLQGAFLGSAWNLLRQLAPLWAIAVLLLGAFIGKFYMAFGGIPSLAAGAGTIKQLPPWFWALVTIGSFYGPIALALAQAIEWRWWLNGIRLGAVAFESALPLRAILVLWLKLFGVILLVFLAFGIFAAFVSFLTTKLVAPQVLASLKYVGVGLAILAYLLLLLVIGVISRYYLQHQLWRALVVSLTIRNLSASDNAIAQGAPANALGEGLLDGLDMAGF